MLRRGDSSASDSSRGRSPRPLSFPNSQQPLSGKMQDLDRQLKHISLTKGQAKAKRFSLTDSEASEGSIPSRYEFVSVCSS